MVKTTSSINGRREVKIRGYRSVTQIYLIPLLFELKDYYCIIKKHLYTSTVTIFLTNFINNQTSLRMQQEHSYYNIENTLIDPSYVLPIPATSQPAAAQHFTIPIPSPNVKTIHAHHKPYQISQRKFIFKCEHSNRQGASTSPHLNFNFIQISHYIVRLVVTLNAQFIIS